MSHIEVTKRNKEIRAKAATERRYGLGKRLAREFGLSAGYVNKIIAGKK